MVREILVPGKRGVYSLAQSPWEMLQVRGEVPFGNAGHDFVTDFSLHRASSLVFQQGTRLAYSHGARQAGEVK